MELKILNLGPIKSIELDLSKDLIVTFGRNNIGKSYAMSTAYLILKQLLKIDRLQLAEVTREITFKELASIREVFATGGDTPDLTQPVNNIIKDILEKLIAPGLENLFKNTFGQLKNLKNYKSKKTPSIRFRFSNHTILISIDSKLQIKEFSTGITITGKKLEGNDIYKKESREYILNLLNPSLNFPEALHIFIDDIIRKFLDLVESKIEDVYYLPASRSGIYTGTQSFYPILAELSRQRTHITQKVELPGLSEPIADYVRHLSQIGGRTTQTKDFLNIAKRIENAILKGEVMFDPEKKRLTYHPEGTEQTLEMSAVSSMISELSPVAAFIKYIIHKPAAQSAKPVLFIEEPEAHLHPEAQVKMAEFITELAKSGVKVMITSHSNYIFNKLSNMVIAKSLDSSLYAPLLLSDDGKGSTGKLLQMDDLGVEDENFIDTADALYEEREHILEEQNN